MKSFHNMMCSCYEDKSVKVKEYDRWVYPAYRTTQSA